MAMARGRAVEPIRPDFDPVLFGSYLITKRLGGPLEFSGKLDFDKKIR